MSVLDRRLHDESCSLRAEMCSYVWRTERATLTDSPGGQLNVKARAAITITSLRYRRRNSSVSRAEQLLLACNRQSLLNDHCVT